MLMDKKKPYPKLNRVVISRIRYDQKSCLANVPIAGFRLDIGLSLRILEGRNFIGALPFILYRRDSPSDSTLLARKCDVYELSFFSLLSRCTVCEMGFW